MADPNVYAYGYDPRMTDVDLNFQSSSKLVALQNQDFYSQAMQGFQGMPPNNQYPPMYPPPPYMGYDGSQGMMPPNPDDEVQVLRAQVAELDQALNREVEANKVRLQT